MNVAEIVKLVASGNVKDVEQQWMARIETDGLSADGLRYLMPILEELVKNDKPEQAGTLAWAAVESLTERRSAEDALDAAKEFVLLLNRCDDLKAQATELYRAVFAERDGLDRLLEESGIAGGRPPRRAIRTLDVCLALEPGCFVIDREDDQAARVDSIERSAWRITVHTATGPLTLGPVEFADRFSPCDAGDLRVLARFDSPRLQEVLAKDPAAVVENLLKSGDHRIDSTQLKARLVPKIIAESNWAKWWSKARSALRQSRHVKVEGRSPYVLEYVPEGHDIHSEFAAQFRMLDTPAEQHTAIEAFLRECGVRRESPDPTVLSTVREAAARRAQRLEKRGDPTALAERIIETQIAVAIGQDRPDDAAVALLASARDPGRLIRACDSPALWRSAAALLSKARPNDWIDVVIDLFPWAPHAVCDELADTIDGSDAPAERVEQVIAAIMTNASDCYESLCWLWEKGLDRARWQGPAPITVLTRILTLLADVQSSDTPRSEKAKAVSAMARGSLSARKYERFVACLGDVEPGMAAALRTQIQRLHNLTRKIEDDLLSHIRAKFPQLYRRSQTPRWSQEDVIYATSEGIRKLELDIHEVVNVKMRENAKAIGAAAEKGDLSENSEYKFALEERDLLRARAAQMQQQFAAARALDPDEVPTDHVDIGCKVTFRHVQTGREAEMTFLGPFDADAERRVYNYKAPLAQEVMGLTVGERVELSMLEPAGLYEITRIRSWTDP